MEKKILKKKAEELYNKLNSEAESSGYFLNPDREFTMALMEGLTINLERYGYLSCPCRLSSGDRSKDMDIICPCDYRDQDVEEYGNCYCALYVSKDIAEKNREPGPIPERRNTEKKAAGNDSLRSASLSYPVWRCKVCGYLCARENPPGICPICKADKERFERFI